MPTPAGPCKPFPRRIARQTKLFSNRSLRRRCRLGGFRAPWLSLLALLFQGLLVEQSFSFSITFSSDASVGNRQVVMTCGIRRPGLLHCLEWWNRVGVLLVEN